MPIAFTDISLQPSCSLRQVLTRPIWTQQASKSGDSRPAGCCDACVTSAVTGQPAICETLALHVMVLAMNLQENNGI